jgi:tRNA 2-selenouridine synthase
MIPSISVEDYFQKNLLCSFPLIDVRSPLEFQKGHIPGSLSIPLFTDEERGKVGTIYKLRGREEAVLLGLELIGPNLKTIAKQVLKLVPEKKALVQCWRGGMRSSSFAELLKTLGFEVYTLKGGYKSFRNWTLKEFQKPLHLRILGGFTGSGKTEILKIFPKLNVQIIDLEKLASHFGSVFGTLGRLIQPSQEQFENDLVMELFLLDRSQVIWMEDESRTLGRIGIPEGVWLQMRCSPLFKIEIPFQKRIDNIKKDYGHISSEFVKECIQKISKRLGGVESQNALRCVHEGDINGIIELLLKYYDRTYEMGQKNRITESIENLYFTEESLPEIADKLIRSTLAT